MTEVRRTSIPQFTLRWILALTAVMAVVSLIFARATQGDAWAGGIVVGVISLGVAFVVYVVMFGAVALFGRALSAMQTRRRARKAHRIADLIASSISTDQAPQRTDENPISTPKLLLWFVTATLLTMPIGSLFASSGTVIQTPQLQPGEVNKTGLTLTLNTMWVDASGYRPVRVSLKSLAGPVTADRVLSIIFRPMQGYTRNESIAVTQTLEIPAGKSTAEAILAVPQLCAWGMFALDVYEDGEYVKQLSVPENSAWTSWGGTMKGEGASPVTLLLSGVDKISSTFLVNPSMELMSIAPDNASATIDPAISNAMVGAPSPGGVATVGSALTSAIPSITDLPVRWIDYSCFDVMLVSLDKLQEYEITHANYRPRMQAIRDWVRNGGTLIVYDAGQRWKKLNELEHLAWIDDDLSHAARADESDPVQRGWQLSPEGLRGQMLFNDKASLNAARANNTQNTSTADEAPFIIHSCGLGIVVALPSDELLSGMPSSAWNWVFNSIGPERWQWSQRWGVSIYQNNTDFWNFLIPGVGLVPVLQFQVLITLFVIILGPVNYYVLRRLGKLNLTVLTVPAGALLVTSALLLYALVADGLSVRARARSFTQLDQRNGEAACWSRLSYYAGLTPSGGLKFTEDTVVIPLTLQALANDEQAGRVLDWKPSERAKSDSPLEQQMTSGWLYSRTPTQFITARIRKCTEQLEIQSGSDGQPRAINHLGTPIMQLLLVDENKKCFTAADTAPNATVTLQPAESQSSAYLKQLEPLLNASLTEVSVVTPAGGPDLFGFGQRHYNQNRYALGMSPNASIPSAAIGAGAGMLEQSLADMHDQLMNDSLPARTYVAIVESSPEIEWGTPAARPEKSLHVIEGTW